MRTGDVGRDVGEDISVMENSDSSYLGTAFRETVGRREAPPLDDNRWSALSVGDAKGSFWLEHVAADGERETEAPPVGLKFEYGPTIGTDESSLARANARFCPVIERLRSRS